MINKEILFMAESLISEHHLDALMEKTLRHLRKILAADAGSIYIFDAENDSLIFKYTQNDSVDIPFKEFSIPMDTESIAGYVGVNQNILRIDDVYEIKPGYEFKFNNDFDLMSGYRTKAMIVIPIFNRDRNLIGIIQLMNKLDGSVFSESDEKVALSLSGIIAVALENSILYDNIEEMWEGFVTASINAIESRDRITSGHTERVTRLTLATAHAMANDTEFFHDFEMSDNDTRVLKYACLLHDFGKIGVSEAVLNKAKKISDDRVEAILFRCRLAKVCCTDVDPSFFDQCMADVVSSNEPTVLEQKISDHLLRYREFTFVDGDGNTFSLLKEDEYEALCIPKGSLTKSELEEMRAHVRYSYDYLSIIPWTKELESVPKIACMHHERMDGTGYPFGLCGDEIHLMGRVMAIADMFDALISPDRPYKKSMNYNEVCMILKKEAERGILDHDIVNFFITKNIYTNN